MKKVLSFSLVIFLLYSSFSVTQISAGTDIQRSIFSKTPSKVASGGVALAAGLYAWRLHSQIKEIDAELDQIEKQVTRSGQQTMRKQELTDKRSQLRLRFILFTLLATGGGATLAYGVGHQFIQNGRIKELMKDSPIEGKISPQDIERMTQGKDNNYLFKYVGAGKDVSVFERKKQLRPGLFYDRSGDLASPGNLPEELEDLKDNQTKGLIAERLGISIDDIGSVVWDKETNMYYFRYVGIGQSSRHRFYFQYVIYDELGRLVKVGNLPKKFKRAKDHQIRGIIFEKTSILPYNIGRVVWNKMTDTYYFEYIGKKTRYALNKKIEMIPGEVYNQSLQPVPSSEIPKKFKTHIH